MTVVDELLGSGPEDRTVRRKEDAYGHLGPLLVEFASLPEDDPRRVELRDQLVVGFLPVVKHIAGRYRGRGEPVTDLEQAGAIGLLHAIRRFDPQQSDNFLAYAVPTITGEVRRHFRDRTWSMRVPRRLKDLQGPIRAAVTSLSDELQRAPRPSEIADRLGVSVEDVVDGLSAQEAHATSSLDAATGPQGSALGELVGRADAELDKVESRQTLRSLLDELPDRERKILLLRFFGDLTQTQIAKQMGISQMHVSRLLDKTLKTLRAGLMAD